MKKKKTKIVKTTPPTSIDWDYSYDDSADFIFDKQSKIICVIIWAIYLISLLTMSFLPGANINSEVSNWGIALHYFGYFFLFMITLITFFVLELKSPIMKTIGFGILIAISTELIQLFIPGRFGSVGDACINLVGLFTLPIILLTTYEQMDEDKEDFIYHGMSPD